MIPYTVCKHRKICICMTKCRASFATELFEIIRNDTVRLNVTSVHIFPAQSNPCFTTDARFGDILLTCQNATKVTKNCVLSDTIINLNLVKR